ncbi:diacylglycerol/lipid kinase family protein [Intestinibacter sp.]
MYHFIVNPNSRTGIGITIWDNFYNILKNKDIDFKVYFTKINYNGTHVAREITSQYDDCHIIAIGGDGTVNEVINGILDFDKATFSYIPTGSSNDFARGLGIKGEPAELLDRIIKRNNIINMNVGTVKNRERERHFVVSCGMGFDAEVCYEAFNSPIKTFLNKIKLGKLTYYIIALKNIMFFKMKKVEISVDNKEYINHNRTLMVTGMNLQYEGGGLKLCPDAKSDDDILDICVVSDMTRLKIFALLPTAFKGKHIKLKGVNVDKCKNINIKSSVPLAVHVDGEHFGYEEEVTMTYEDSKLEVVY